MYLDLKRVVVRYLLRIHLRPLGEQRYRDQKKKYAEKKASKAAEKLKSPYVSRNARRWAVKKLLVQLDVALHTCIPTWNGEALDLRDPVDMKGKQSRITRVKNVLNMVRKVNDQIKGDNKDIENKDIENKDIVMDDDDDFDMMEMAREEDDFDYVDENDLVDEEDEFVAAADEEAHVDGVDTQEEPSDLAPVQEPGATGMKKYYEHIYHRCRCHSNNHYSSRRCSSHRTSSEASSGSRGCDLSST